MSSGYNIADYGRMIADRVRMNAYTQALRQTVKPGAVVVEIGTGLGIFAMLACKLGARRVYAIEPNDVVQIAQKIAADNGCADRIEFVQDLSTRITLPERADVIVSDLRGKLPLFERHIASIVDARERLLAPGGVLIPERDTLWSAVVEIPELYDASIGPWRRADDGFNLTRGADLVANRFYGGRVKPDQLLTGPQSWAALDYSTVVDPNVSGQAAWTVARNGLGHGIAIWFDTVLTDGVGFSSGPFGGAPVYSMAFLPWPEPISLEAGDTVSVALRSDLVGDDYMWSWKSCVRDGSRPAHVKGNFNQTTFFGMSLSSARLHKQHADYVPVLNDRGESDRFILDLMTGNLSLSEIARRALTQFPVCFATEADATARVFELSEKYSR